MCWFKRTIFSTSFIPFEISFIQNYAIIVRVSTMSGLQEYETFPFARIDAIEDGEAFNTGRRILSPYSSPVSISEIFPPFIVRCFLNPGLLQMVKEISWPVMSRNHCESPPQETMRFTAISFFVYPLKLGY